MVLDDVKSIRLDEFKLEASAINGVVAVEMNSSFSSEDELGLESTIRSVRKVRSELVIFIFVDLFVFFSSSSSGVVAAEVLVDSVRSEPEEVPSAIGSGFEGEALCLDEKAGNSADINVPRASSIAGVVGGEVWGGKCLA